MILLTAAICQGKFRSELCQCIGQHQPIDLEAVRNANTWSLHSVTSVDEETIFKSQTIPHGKLLMTSYTEQLCPVNYVLVICISRVELRKIN